MYEYSLSKAELLLFNCILKTRLTCSHMLSFTAKNDIILSTKGLDFGCPRGVPKASLNIPVCSQGKKIAT